MLFQKNINENAAEFYERLSRIIDPVDRADPQGIYYDITMMKISNLPIKSV